MRSVRTGPSPLGATTPMAKSAEPLPAPASPGLREATTTATPFKPPPTAFPLATPCATRFTLAQNDPKQCYCGGVLCTLRTVLTRGSQKAQPSFLQNFPTKPLLAVSLFGSGGVRSLLRIPKLQLTHDW